ncbi:AraC family transcriptional regulator [Paraburkholderia sp. ZP32-5]|uniref:AraC family transcriptional regulator n=1 Tax=Paraburkholderia sp. ZP32-5 TaxID=2883245 RepID=UPI001F3ADB61|nr:AraC family transcriptional regulator [Paraburkholderia sp. ZP32-5]
MPGHYVRSSALVGSIPLIEGLGGDAKEVANAVGLDFRTLTDPDLPVLVSQIFEFYEYVAAEFRCRNFGLLMASRANMAVLGPLWILLRQAQTIGQMVEDLVNHFNIYTRDVDMSLTRQPGGQLLTWTALPGAGGRDVQVAEYSLAVTCTDLRSHAPSQWEPKRVYFRHSKPRDIKTHQKVFGPNVLFDQEFNGIFLENAVLDTRLRSAGSRTRTLLARILRSEEGSPDAGLIDQVDATMRVMIPYGPCTLADVSQAMGMAPRTLQLHLQSLGAGFKELKDAVRADLAMKYLRDSSLDVSEIAEILGYSETSALSRSFRRWYGKSPTSVR